MSTLNTEIAIIGGGLAGLALADILERQGVDFLLLEGRDRLGGRILSQEIGGAAFDLGPAWFWPGQPRMAALVERLGLRIFEQHWTGDLVAEDHQGRVTRGRGFASMQGSWRLDGGLSRLIDGLAKGIARSRIHLGSTARVLARDGDGIVVTAETAEGQLTVRAGRVVFAAPPRLAPELIAFTPPLPKSARESLQAVPTWMAGQAKLLAIYDRPYWREAGLSGDAMSRTGPLGEIHDASPRQDGPFALFGFVGVAPDARQGRRDEVIELARTQLGRLFGEAMLHPLALVLEDWAQEPLTATALDRVPTGGHPVYGRGADTGKAWRDHLHMAGTETAPASGGFLEGALEAAELVAERCFGLPPDRSIGEDRRTSRA